MPLEKQPESFHISIIGNVGTGKSTLARLIQQRLPCQLYLEDPEDYLFVRLFFDAPHDWGFANLLHFVMVKTAQQAQIRQQEQLAVQEMNAYAIRCIWAPALHEISYISQKEMTTIEQKISNIQKPIMRCSYAKYLPVLKHFWTPQQTV